MYKTSLIILLFLASTPIELSAQSVQRLFSTPEQRAVLDRRRILAAQPGAVEEEFIEPEIEPVTPVIVVEEPADIIISLGGAVRSSEGYYTVWINGEPIEQNDLPENMELIVPFSRGQLRIRNTESDLIYDIKPGQILNLTTGQLYESYEVVLSEERIEGVASPEEAVNSQGNDVVTEPATNSLTPTQPSQGLRDTSQ